MKEFFRKLKSFLREAIAPSEFKCLCCGVDVFDDTGFCQNCRKDVVFNNGKTCKRCGVALHGAEDYCGHCAYEHIYFDRAYSPFSYTGSVQKAILDMKFHRLACNARVLARYLVFMAKRQNLKFDVVTFVPMTKKAQKARGYNQSQLLAESFCDILQIAPPVALLQKIKDTKRQEQLGKTERKENLVGAFRATSDVKGETVLLVDDIKTTGATLNECAKALKVKGAACVICLTVASREENMQWEIEEEV